MFRLLKLLHYLREINLSSEEALALLRRLETDSFRPEDYEVLIRVMRAHTKLSAEDLDALRSLDGPSLARWLSPQEGVGNMAFSHVCTRCGLRHPPDRVNQAGAWKC